MLKRNSRMQKHINDLTEEKQMDFFLQQHCGKNGLKKLNDPFRQTNGFITDKKHLKEQNRKGQ